MRSHLTPNLFVIEVPKILLDDVPVRTAVRVPQLAEQLVEVPTVVSCSSFQQTMEQHVDIPVPGRGGRNVGLQGFLPGQNSTAPVAQIVANPAPSGGPKGFRPGQSSSASSSSPAGVHGFADELGAVVFRTFPRGKKCGGRRPGGCESASALELLDDGGLEAPSGADEWVELYDDVMAAVKGPF